MGEPYQRKGRKNYHLEFTDQHGQLHKNVNLHVTDKKVALQLAAKIEEDVDRLKAGLPIKHVSVTEPFLGLATWGPGRRDWEETCEQYVDDLKRRGGSPRVLIEVRGFLKRVARELQLTYLSDLSREAFTAWLGGLARAGVASSSQNHYHTLARAFLGWCEDMGWLGQVGNVLKGIKRSRAGVEGKRRPRRALLLEELQKLLVATKELRGGKMRVIAYQVSAYAGWRRIELRRLRREDCTPLGPRPRWHTRAEVAKNRKSANLPMTRECAEVLRPLWEATAPGQLLFPHTPHQDSFERDRELANIAKVDERGRHASYHSLRYTFCTLMAKVQPIEVVAKLMRHGSLNLTTEVYLDLGLDRIGEGEWVLPPLLPSLPNPLP